MPEVLEDHKSAARVIAEALEEKLNTGWKVVSVVEQSFRGELQDPEQHDYAVCDPMNVTIAHFYLQHGDHYHEWVIILAKPGMNMSANNLGADFLTLLKMMDMDEKATTIASGHA